MKKYKFALPFIDNYVIKPKPFITMGRVQTFLGFNFYPRLNNIYINICEAISKNNYRYISTYFEKQFSEKLIKEMNSLNEAKYRIKIKNPKAKIILVKPRKKIREYFKFRDNTWDNNQTKIGITCFVYFGQQFQANNPFGKQGVKNIKVGQFRYLAYDKELSVFQNIMNWYRYQTYQFVIKYTSKIHLEAVLFGQRQMNKEEDTSVTSQVTMRSGNQKFDYVITDINGLSKKI